MITIPANVYETEEGRELIERLLRIIPTFCPKCGLKHPSDQFRMTEQYELKCVSCGYVLQETDYWADEVSFE